MSDYISRIENGESPLSVFSPVSEYKRSLSDFISKFPEISGISVQPSGGVSVYSRGGKLVKIGIDGSCSGNMGAGGGGDRALLSDLSQVKWMLDAFAVASRVPKKAFTVGIVQESWLKVLVNS